MKSFFFLPMIPTSLALVTPLKRLTPDLHPRDAHWATKSWSQNPHPRTITVTTTLTVTITALPTANGTFPNMTTTDAGATATSSDGLAPITLITLPSEVVSTTTGSSDGFAPITLIEVDTAVPKATGSGEGNAAVPTPNDIEPITLIDISTVTPI